MSRIDYTILIDKVTQEVKSIADDKVQGILTSLLNLIEALVAENNELRSENQRLRDEVNHLKGEQGKPSIRKQTKPNKNHSSEEERKKRNKDKSQRKKAKKKGKITKIRFEICSIDKKQLPTDAVFKGYQSVVIQDIIIKTDNIEFKKETYYSPSHKKTFIAPLPTGYQGTFGPTIRALIISLYYDLKMTESNIHKFFTDHGILISMGSISNFLINNQEEFHQEKRAIVMAGLTATNYQQMDDTSARVCGKNHYAHILCNEFYTAYFTRRYKDRLTIIEILTQDDMMFTFNEHTYSLMKEMGISNKMLNKVNARCSETNMNRQAIDIILNEFFPDQHKQLTNQRIILEASAIVAYQALPYAVTLLLTDDAPQYNKITPYHPLCWIHDGRHYKKLEPVCFVHREQIDNYLKRYWEYYDKLLDYKLFPSPTLALALKNEFDILFSTKTEYEKLDERISKTRSNKDQLLLVLDHPHLPLHNNDSELGAREQSRRRDISFHTMSQEGTQAKDTFMTIAKTSKKLAVNFYRYVCDRISKKYEMPSLDSLIVQLS